MVDGILVYLFQQRIMAAKQFLGFCPVGSYYDYNGQVCIVTGYDAKTGFLNLQPTSGGGAILNPDPISILYPNATAAATSAAAHGVTGATTGQNIVQATSGSSAATLGAAVGPALGVLPYAGKLFSGSKVPKGAPGAHGVPGGAAAGGATTFDPYVPSADLVNGSQKVADMYQANANQATKSLNDFLNYGQPPNTDPLYSFDKMSLPDALKIANQNATQLYFNGVDNLKEQIAQINSKIASIGSRPTPSISNVDGTFEAPRHAGDIPGGLTFQSDSTPWGAPVEEAPLHPVENITGITFSQDLTAEQSSRLQYLTNRRAGLEQQLADQLKPGAQQNAVAATMNKFSDAVIQQNQLSQVATDTAHFNNVVQQALSSPASYGETLQAAGQLQLGGQKLSLLSDGMPNMADQQTAALVNAQIRTNRVDNLSQYSTDQADQILHAPTDTSQAPTYTATIDEKGNIVYKLEDPGQHAVDTGDFSDYQQNISLKNGLDYQKQLLHKAEIKFGTEMALAAAAAYGEERAWDSIFHNGLSIKNLIGAGIAAVSLIGLMHAIHGALANGQQMMMMLTNNHSFLNTFLGMNLGNHIEGFLKFLTGKWGILFVQAAIIFFGWLFGHDKPSPEQQAAEQLNAEVNPVVWNPNGQVIFLTAGLTMATMGLILSPSAPLMQTLTLTQAQATQAITNAGASSVPTDSTRYADVFVKQGAGGQPTQVVWLTPVGTDSKGNVIEKVTVETLNRNFQFATSQPPTGYVPFFINGPGGQSVPNPQVVQSLAAQQHLTQCANAPGVWVTNQVECIDSAGAARLPGGG